LRFFLKSKLNARAQGNTAEDHYRPEHDPTATPATGGIQENAKFMTKPSKYMEMFLVENLEVTTHGTSRRLPTAQAATACL
jgi:hypothetical protein